jgi:methanethiol S-methyltransferase
VFFFGVFLWLIAFSGDFTVTGIVTETISHGALAGGFSAAIVDVVLLALFGSQHRPMARSGFKRWWTRMIPVQIERSTYVLASSVVLVLLMWQWQPVDGMVSRIESPVAIYLLYGLFVFGCVFILISFWAAPQMTIGYLVFSAGFTLYVFISIHFEERGLLREWGPDYAAWCSRIPMILPVGRG